MSEHRDHQNPLHKIVDKAQDMMGGAVGMASATTAGSHDSRAFVMNAAVGDLYEIEAGRLALQRARGEDVRMFAAMMVEHHTTSMHQMQSALSKTEVTSELPDLDPVTALDERRKGMIDNLASAGDVDFDGRYLDQQRMSHRETVALLEGYAEHGSNPQLRSVAAGALPMVRRHLASLQRVGSH